MTGGKHAGRAAAEVDRARGFGGLGEALLGFRDEGIDKGADGSSAWSVLVKRAVRADAVAEGDVEVNQQGGSLARISFVAKAGDCCLNSKIETTKGTKDIKNEDYGKYDSIIPRMGLEKPELLFREISCLSWFEFSLSG